LEVADLAVRDYLGLKRSEQRFSVGPQSEIQISSKNSSGTLVDYSLNGLGLKLNEYYARGVKLALAMETPDGRLGERCRKRGLLPLEVEVCWAKPDTSGNAFSHGTIIRDLSQVQRADLFNILQREVAALQIPKGPKAA
jgi:hypothetical protein